ncbi:MAG: apolipoprotein N-acyltransferase [Deltaproteobacteria bacterium]|nr:apolipoprotein N-acyltransferase [Deltaproteobacteria bacterium]
MNINVLALSLLSALFYVLASPFFDLEPLGWLAIAPLIGAVTLSRSLKEAFLAGLAAGVAAYSGLCYWLINTMVNFGGLGYLASFFFFLFLNLYLALYWAFFTLLLKKISQRGLSLILGAPSLWVALEYLRTYLFTGHPWGLIAYTQYKNIYAIQLADCLGVYGISFILVLFSSLFFQIVAKFIREKALPFRELAMLLLLIGLTFSYGIIKVNYYKAPEKTFQAGLIQGNIDQALKWDKKYTAKTIAIYEELSQKALRESGDLHVIIWPETAVPFYFQQPGILRNRVMRMSGTLDSPIIFGSPAYSFKEDQKINYLNSAFLISPDKEKRKIEVIDRYDKIHLVPFGEYVPLKKLLFFVEKITQGIGDFTPGKGVMTLDVEVNNSDKVKLSFGPLICYEAIFPDLVRRFVKEGANVLVNITNDGWYGKTSAPYQHLSAITFRSVENGVYMLRSANTGVTAIVDPLGRIVKETKIYEESFITGKISPSRKKTFYTRYGDLFAMFVSIIAILLLALSIKPPNTP